MTSSHPPLVASGSTLSPGNPSNTTKAADLASRPGRILGIVFCSIFVGFILIALLRLLFYKATSSYAAAHPSGHEDDSTHASGSDGASVLLGSRDVAAARRRGAEEGSVGWDIEQALGVEAFLGAASSRHSRFGFLTRPRPTVPRERDRAGWKTPPPAYTPPPVYSSVCPVAGPESVIELQVAQFARPAPV